MRPPVFSALQSHCLAKPGAFEVEQWGLVVWKSPKGKVFAMMDPSVRAVTIKATLERQEGLLLHPQITKAAYVGRFGWVTVGVDTKEMVSLAKDLIDEAFESLGPKKPPKKS